MKKKALSRTIAALASTAVLGAVSMLSANAAAESLSLSSAEGLPGQTVSLSVNVACNNNFESLDTVLVWDDTALKAAQAQPANGVSVASDAGDGYCTVVAYGSAAIADGAVATIDFTIPANAQPGTTYTVNFGVMNTFAIFEGDDIASSVPTNSGTITVTAPEEPTEPTTEAPTEATTEAPAEAATEAETAAPVVAQAVKTGTGDLAVAVAGLVLAGTVAVVLKKKY